MNLGKITKYAALLLAVQVVIGFLEGSFAPTSAGAGLGLMLVSSAITFLMCGFIFAHFSARQSVRPYTHAWAALALQVVAASLLLGAMPGWIGGVSLPLLALEWLVLVLSLLSGTFVGSSRRRGTDQPADA